MLNYCYYKAYYTGNHSWILQTFCALDLLFAIFPQKSKSNANKSKGQTGEYLISRVRLRFHDPVTGGQGLCQRYGSRNAVQYADGKVASQNNCSNPQKDAHKAYQKYGKLLYSSMIVYRDLYMSILYPVLHPTPLTYSPCPAASGGFPAFALPILPVASAGKSPY